MRRLIGILVLLVFVPVAAAQSGGQLCVRAFEDRDGSGILDAGEPLLTWGISVSLLDASGVTVGSALMDTSPTATQGVICFQGLPGGQYTVAITSADFTATTPDMVTTTVAESGSPTVIEYGGRLPVAPTSAAPAAPSQASIQDEVLRWALASAGALIVVVGMGVLGTFIYLFFFRNRPTPNPAATDPSRTTGSMRAVRSRDTSEYPRVE